MSHYFASKKQRSLVEVQHELSFNFCPICLTYQCVSHLEHNTDNDWAISTPKRHPTVVYTDSSTMEVGKGRLAYLKGWKERVDQLTESMTLVTSYRCEQCLHGVKTADSTPQKNPVNAAKLERQVNFLTDLLSKEVTDCYLARLLNVDCEAISKARANCKKFGVSSQENEESPLVIEVDRRTLTVESYVKKVTKQFENAYTKSDD